MVWLPEGEKCLICLAVSTQYGRVTETDWQTDSIVGAVYSIAR